MPLETLYEVLKKVANKKWNCVILSCNYDFTQAVTLTCNFKNERLIKRLLTDFTF